MSLQLYLFRQITYLGCNSKFVDPFHVCVRCKFVLVLVPRLEVQEIPGSSGNCQHHHDNCHDEGKPPSRPHGGGIQTGAATPESVCGFLCRMRYRTIMLFRYCLFICYPDY